MLPTRNRILRATAVLAGVAGLALLGRAALAQKEGMRQWLAIERAYTRQIPASERHILVDRFGYRPDDPKFAVLRDPDYGYDADDHFHPGDKIELRSVADDHVVFEAPAKPWRAGLTEYSSGDKGWWFDFSRVKSPGHYQVVDRASGARSAAFEIGPDVYRTALRAAVRMFYYQRSGFAKKTPYAEACWTDEAAYVGPGQDGEARDITDRDNPRKARDLRGGWFDAGDTNKYITFAATPVHQLLDAYTDNPHAFTDDTGIPESGNGVPDILDEIAWETDWFRRMQADDGGVALKVGAISYVRASPPSSDHSPRYYIPSCTSSTVAFAGTMAHAALVFRGQPALAARGRDLADRAVRAWKNFRAAPELQEHCDAGVVLSGNADVARQDQLALGAEASIYLYALTGDGAYESYLAEHLHDLHPYRDVGWERYHPDEGRALLFYSTLRGARADLQQAVREDFRREVSAGNGVFGPADDDDLYRAFLHDQQYHWGSNNIRANYGGVNLDALRFPVAGGDARPEAALRTRALDTLHYFHGVNPFGLAMLSNLRELGPGRSLDEIYHVWFAPGGRWGDAQDSACGPAPGYVPGGANASVGAQGVPDRLVPPSRQPSQKSFRVSNDPRVAAWTFSEPGIYYQSAYIKLVSAFVP